MRKVIEGLKQIRDVVTIRAAKIHYGEDIPCGRIVDVELDGKGRLRKVYIQDFEGGYCDTLFFKKGVLVCKESRPCEVGNVYTKTFYRNGKATYKLFKDDGEAPLFASPTGDWLYDEDYEEEFYIVPHRHGGITAELY